MLVLVLVLLLVLLLSTVWWLTAAVSETIS